jgi:Flp pilus assembly protein TadG
LPTFWNNLTLPLVRVGALACLFGIVAFGIYQYQQHEKIMQASRDLNYALSKLNYAVERTNIVVSEKLPDAQINKASRDPFVQIEEASRRALKKKMNISSAIHRSLDSLNRASENAPNTEQHQTSQQGRKNR